MPCAKQAVLPSICYRDRGRIACSKNEEHQSRSIDEEVDQESKGHAILKSFVFTSGVQPLKSLIRKIIHNNCNVITTKNFRGKLNHNLYKCGEDRKPQKFILVYFLGNLYRNVFVSTIAYSVLSSTRLWSCIYGDIISTYNIYLILTVEFNYQCLLLFLQCLIHHPIRCQLKETFNCFENRILFILYMAKCVHM